MFELALIAALSLVPCDDGEQAGGSTPDTFVYHLSSPPLRPTGYRTSGCLFSSDGGSLFVLDDEAPIRRWDISKRHVVQTYVPTDGFTGATSFALTPDGTRFVAINGSYGGEESKYVLIGGDMATGKTLWKTPAIDGLPQVITGNADGTLVAFTAMSSETAAAPSPYVISIHRVADGERVGTIRSPARVMAMAFDPTRPQILVGTSAASLTAYDLPIGQSD